MGIKVSTMPPSYKYHENHRNKSSHSPKSLTSSPTLVPSYASLYIAVRAVGQTRGLTWLRMSDQEVNGSDDHETGELNKRGVRDGEMDRCQSQVKIVLLMLPLCRLVSESKHLSKKMPLKDPFRSSSPTSYFILIDCRRTCHYSSFFPKICQPFSRLFSAFASSSASSADVPCSSSSLRVR